MSKQPRKANGQFASTRGYTANFGSDSMRSGGGRFKGVEVGLYRVKGGFSAQTSNSDHRGTTPAKAYRAHLRANGRGFQPAKGAGKISGKAAAGRKVGKTLSVKKVHDGATFVTRQSSRLPKLKLTMMVRPNGVDVFSNKHGGQAITTGKTIKQAYRNAHKGWAR